LKPTLLAAAAASFVVGRRLSPIGAMLLLSAIPALADYVCVPKSFPGANYLNLRTGPGIDYPPLGPLTNRTVVTVIRKQDDWLEVRSATGDSGWVDRRRICVGVPSEDR
jgi:N-acetylmuramoyl-L-alanine amidase